MNKSRMFVLLSVAMCSLAGATPARAQTSESSGGGAARQLDELTQQMAQAQRNGDPTAFERHYADNAVIVHATGQLFTKSEEIANLKSGVTKYESYDVRDKKIQLYGDTAVVELLVSANGKLKGNPFNADFRVTRVWVKSNGTWQVVVFQTTRVAPAH